MIEESRQVLLLRLTKKLVICASISLSLIAVFFFLYYSDNTDRSYIVLVIFAAGLIGGFVSIQQRVHKISNDELRYLSKSWPSILLIPIYGGIFAVVLHIIFLSEIVSGNLFPNYAVPKFKTPPDLSDLKKFFSHILPLTSADTAKMIFWAFISGFSERFVPQIIKNVTSNVDQVTNNEN